MEVYEQRLGCQILSPLLDTIYSSGEPINRTELDLKGYPYTLALDTSEIGKGEVKTLNMMAEFPNVEKDIAGHYMLGLVDDTDHTRYYRINSSLFIQNELNALTLLLGGGKVEIDTSRAQSSDPRSDEDWSGWKLWSYELQGLYAEAIYPAVIKQIRTLLNHGNKGIVNWEMPYQIIDLFGGDGQFWQVFNEMHPDITSALNYHVIDRNLDSLKWAQKSLASYPGVMVHPPIDIVTESDIFKGVSDGRNIVTAIGGLNSNVLTRQHALGVVRKIFEWLNPGDYFIVTGYTVALLNANDYRSISVGNRGFDVLNMSIPRNFVNSWLPTQLYVLQKRAMS